MTTQKLLEGEKYVTFSLFVSYINDIQDGLNNALNYLKLPVPADDPVKITTRKAVVPCVEALAEDLDNRWGMVRMPSCTGKGRQNSKRGSHRSRS